MIIKWPIEKQNLENQSYNYDYLDPCIELPELLKISSFSDELNNLRASIEEKVASTEELRVEAYKIIETLNLNSHEDYQDLLIAYACSLSLSNEPTLANWVYIKQIWYNSWYIENYLYNIIIYSIEVGNCTAHPFINLAKSAFTSLEKNSLTSKSERKNKTRNNHINYWNSEKNKLEQLWWGLRNNEISAYEDESILFRVLFKLDKNELINQISSSTNPFFIDSVLWSIGTGMEYNSWAEIATLAPTAFNDDCSWTQSPIIPLLLVSAHSQIVSASNSIPRHNPDQTQIKEAKEYIAKLVKAVIEIISKRDDATAIFQRWSTWLMRNILIQNNHNESDIFSSSYLDTVLIDEIGQVLQDKILLSPHPVDAISWESWSYTTLLSHYLWKGYISKIDINYFIDPWTITTDTWKDIKSENLKNNVSMFMSLSENIPISAYSFSYPISQERKPEELWLNTWINLQPIKDIVEFGYPGEKKEKKYDENTIAHKILLSFLYLGVGVLDCLKEKNNNKSGRLLYKSLFEAIDEMREINYFIDKDKFSSLFNHIMIRRIIWEGTAETNSFFTECSSPTIKDTIIKMSNDIVDVWRLIQVFNVNKIDLIKIADILKEASIDLGELDNQMQFLNNLDKTRYPYDSTLVTKLKSCSTQ